MSNAIAWAGYLPPLEEVVDGATRLVEQPQSDLFVWVLRLIFALVPIVLLIVALVFARRFPLTPEVHERLRRLLDARRSGEPETDGMRREAEALEKLLIGG